MAAATTAVIAATTASSTSAMLAARRAREERAACELFVPEFKHSTATIEEARQYGHCIQLLHPLPAADLWVPKLLIALALLFFAGGTFWHKFSDGYDSWADHLFLGGFGGLLLYFALLVAFVAVGFLFFA